MEIRDIEKTSSVRQIKERKEKIQLLVRGKRKKRATEKKREKERKRENG